VPYLAQYGKSCSNPTDSVYAHVPSSICPSTSVKKRSPRPHGYRYSLKPRQDDGTVTPLSNYTGASNSTVAQFVGFVNQTQFDETTISDVNGTIALYPHINGNLFAATLDEDTDFSSLYNSSTFAADYVNNFVYGDSNGRLLYYYPPEMSATGVSRIRLGEWGSIPLTAQLLMLTPFTSPDVDTSMLVAIDTSNNSFWMVVCALDQQLNKIFIVQDEDAGVTTLMDPNLKFTITGGNVTGCAPLALIAAGLNSTLLPASDS
jgi:hypothetical protein